MKARSTTPILDAEIGRERGNGWESASDFSLVRRTTQALCSELTAEDCMVQSMADASPVKWHLAHTAWFWETFLLSPHLQGYKPLNAEYRTLFNSYYNAVGDRPQRDSRGVFSRPSLDEIYAYRQHVDQYMLELLHNSLP